MEKKRYILIDWLKAICVLLVIITHSDFLNDAMLNKSGLFYLLCVNKAVPMFMFLSGYVFTLGAKNITLSEQYRPQRLLPKLLRLTVPTVIYYIAFVCVQLLSGEEMGIAEIVKRFIAGDFGRGSYYFAVMVQFTLIAPLMYHIIKKYALRGVAIIGLINFAYELFWTFMDLPDGLYRILALRYLLIIAFGMYFAKEKHRKINPFAVAFMALIGLIYILLPYFTAYEYKLFTVEPWNRSGMMSAFYVAAVGYVLFYFFGNIQKNDTISKAIAKVGQASYHIMYTQMMYFVLRPATDKLIFDLTKTPIFYQYIADIVVSVALGLVFCVVDNKFFGKFYKTK